MLQKYQRPLPKGAAESAKAIHCPLRQGSATVYRKSPLGHYPEALPQWKQDPLPTPLGSAAVYHTWFHCPPPTGGAVVCCKSTKALQYSAKAIHYPLSQVGVTAGVPLPTAPMHYGSAPLEFH